MTHASGASQTSATRIPSLVFSAGAMACAVPLVHVVEVMRPLPIDPVAGSPPFVLGLSLIRGGPVPVVDLRALMGMGRAHDVARFVSLKLEQRRVALAVEAVEGTCELEASRLGEMPPLLRGARADVVDSIGVVDARLLVVLRASRILPAEIVQGLVRREVSA
jgi:purine-binding chemotaxis protein CheW